MKVIWIDTETTGLDPVQNDIWQLAYIFMDNGREVLRNTIECKPWAPWNANPNALQVGITQDGRKVADVAKIDYDGFMPPWSAIDRFTFDLQSFIDKYDKFDKAAIGGYNVIFDINFLSWWFKKGLKKYGLGSFTDYTIVDAAPMMRMMRHMEYINIKNCKLSTVAEFYDVTLDNAHNAMSDVEASIRVYPPAINNYHSMINQPQYFGQLTEYDI